jgi:hypothetical protein
MIWRPFDQETAPKDRPIAILRVVPESKATTIAVSKWLPSYHDWMVYGTACESAGTHWCEVDELELPK